MKRIIRLTESDLTRIVKQVIQEQSEHVKNLYKSWANKRSGNPEEALKLMDDETFRYTQAVRLIKQRYTFEDIKRNSTTAGVTSAMDQIAKSMDPFNLAQQATLGLFSKIDDSIRQLVTTGKTSFGDLARSFGQMILEMMLLCKRIVQF
jgi:lambda family phage tail tape measure protein